MTNPLDRALTDAESSQAARSYTVPVDQVRRRIRRRRRVRAGAVTGGAALAVTAAVIVLPGLLASGLGTAPGSTADWPGQFDRCGRPVQEVLRTIGDIHVSATLGEGSGNEVALHVTTTAAGAASGWSYGLQLLVTDDDGTVIGVQEGPFVPDPDQLDDYYAAASFAAVPFPMTSDKQMPLVSCAQYPSGEGSAALRAGAYDLWVVQTVGLALPGDAGSTYGRAAVELPLVVSDAGVPGPSPTRSTAPLVPHGPVPTAAAPADDLFACGRPVDVTIHTLPDAGGLTLAADLPDKGWGALELLSAPGVGIPPAWSVTLGSSQDHTLHARGASAGSIAFVDDTGVVVGMATPSGRSHRTVTVGPDATQVLDGPTAVRDCPGRLLEGTLTAWPFVVETLLDDGGREVDTVVVVANPRQVTFPS